MEIDEKKLKEILKEQKEEYQEDGQRYLKVLSEKADANFKLLSEQYSSIKETLDIHTDQIASIKETLDVHTVQISSIKETLDNHTEQFVSIKETLDNNTEMTASTKEDVEIIKMDIEFIKNSLKKKVDAEEFSVLEKRVAFLEAKVRAR